MNQFLLYKCLAHKKWVKNYPILRQSEAIQLLIYPSVHKHLKYQSTNTKVCFKNMLYPEVYGMIGHKILNNQGYITSVL